MLVLNVRFEKLINICSLIAPATLNRDQFVAMNVYYHGQLGSCSCQAKLNPKPLNL